MLDHCFLIAAVASSVPFVVLGLELWAACAARKTRRVGDRAAAVPRSGELSENQRPAVAVLIPAHNEELVVEQSLRSVREQLGEQDRLVVVADNCSDRTAEISRAWGAEVVERQDTTRRGKQYALYAGCEYLRKCPPEFVIVVDADCELEAGCIESLIRAASCGRPVQAAFEMSAPPDGRATDRLSAFAVLVRNVVRPLGLKRLGAPCLINGSGFLLPWHVAERYWCLESGQLTGAAHLVEDRTLAIRLICEGIPPVFEPRAVLSSVLPCDREAKISQRRRWEQSVVRTSFWTCVRVLRAALKNRRPTLLITAVEASMPPLSITGGVWFGMVLCGSSLLMTQPTEAVRLGLAILLSSGLLAAAAFPTVWAMFGRECVRLGDVLSVPGYVLAKRSVYSGVFRKPQLEWVRTSRTQLPTVVTGPNRDACGPSTAARPSGDKGVSAATSSASARV